MCGYYKRGFVQVRFCTVGLLSVYRFCWGLWSPFVQWEMSSPICETLYWTKCETVKHDNVLGETGNMDSKILQKRKNYK